jgi:hypothetical protein
MTILAIAIGLVGLVGVIFLWLRLEKVKATVADIEQIHGSGITAQTVSTDFGMFTATEGEERQAFIILGVRYETIILADNQSNGQNLAERQFAVDIPEGTVEVVPLVRGFFRFYGDIIDFDENHLSAEITDHNFAFDWVNIRTVALVHGKAFMEAQMLLRDKDGDDSWSGVMGVVIFCLGYHPS